ncbi:hypothetical protein QCA50_017290 [Cerrena zonata]|uniref:Uncharacterized protein n=1 Tax=Cerrena zonata TaxID=2478898 RepID=A0AAW0FKM9_9APHY
MSHISASTSHFAERRKEQLLLVKKLRSIGAQADIDLPQIVAIGNQSAGKSSLVEAISGISLPRDPGTCTRAPIECQLSSSEDPWACTVSVRWEFSSDGRRLDQVKTIGVQQDIDSMADVELALRRAQHWVLNPSHDLKKICGLNIEGLKKEYKGTLEFSRNVICLDVSGPDITNLSFVDLPGIIQNAEKELVHMVEDLVLSYIRSKCLILVTIPMSDDIENQRAVRLAKEVDPEGHRTIGVLTKPDTLTAGAVKVRELWLDVIEDRRHKLKYGYYCTRQPDEDERMRGITVDEAPIAEERFFSQTAPWSSSSYRHRFGTKHLVESLSMLLSKVIVESIPKLVQEVQLHLDGCEAQIAALPPPITDPSAHVFNLISSLCSNVHFFTQGDTPKTDLVQQNRKTYELYKQKIHSTAPLFLPFADSSFVESKKDLIKILYDEDDPRSKSPPAEGTYLTDVRKHIQSSLARELPNNVPYSAKVVLIHSFQRDWKSLSMNCFAAVQMVLREITEKLISDVFHRHPNLEPKIRLAVSELIVSKRDDTMRQLERLLRYESLPFTQNSDSLAQVRDTYLWKYKEIRTGTRSSNPNGNFPGSSVPNPFAGFVAKTDSPFSVFSSPAAPATGFPIKSGQDARKDVEAQALSYLARLGYTGLKVEDLARLIPPDEYEEELEVMADVQAFFQVSYKRVIDYVPMIIDHEYLFAFSEALQGHLIEYLGLSGRDSVEKCAAYVAEDNQTKSQRVELTSQKARLVTTRKELLEVAL